MSVDHNVVRQVLADVDVALRDVQRDMSWIPLVSIGTGLLAAEMLAPAEMTLPSRCSKAGTRLPGMPSVPHPRAQRHGTLIDIGVVNQVLSCTI